MSCDAPAWVKTDESRFPCARNSAGEAQEIIIPFSENALSSDKRAFAALIQHVKSIDNQQHTVLMVQVENEIGMLPEARDYSKMADKAFASPVPSKLLAYLEAHRNSLVSEIKIRWQDNGFKTSGTWEEIF